MRSLLRSALASLWALLVAAPAGAGPPGADRLPERLVVPARDQTPPVAMVRLSRPPATPLRPGDPPLRAIGVASDSDGGVARVRLSISERIACLDPATGVRFVRPRVRNLPPSQIMRIRVPPGVRQPLERRRTATVAPSGDPCPGLVVDRIDGRVHADATNAHELESSSPPARFSYRRTPEPWTRGGLPPPFAPAAPPLHRSHARHAVPSVAAPSTA